MMSEALQVEDALRQAKVDMGYYEEWADNSPVVPAPELLVASAQAYATIAQAEQLKRMADYLEGYLSSTAIPPLSASPTGATTTNYPQGRWVPAYYQDHANHCQPTSTHSQPPGLGYRPATAAMAGNMVMPWLWQTHR